MSKKFISVKEVALKPMSYRDFLKKSKDNTVKSIKPDIQGYIVTYQNGYQSWMPEAILKEEHYEPLEAFSFSTALYFLKKGRKVARKGWNGKGMYIYMQEGTKSVTEMRNNHLDHILERDGSVEILPHIDMKSADDRLVIGWLASQTDMLSEDWVLVED